MMTSLALLLAMFVGQSPQVNDFDLGCQAFERPRGIDGTDLPVSDPWSVARYREHQRLVLQQMAAEWEKRASVNRRNAK